MRRDVVSLCVLFWLVGGTPALAYIDPGMGSLLQQGFAALLASGAVLLFSMRGRLASLVGRGKDRPDDAPGSAKD